MSEFRIPQLGRGDRDRTPGRVRVATGAVALMVGMFSPLFAIEGSREGTLNLFDLGRVGAPLVPLLFAAAMVLAVLGLVPDRALPNLRPVGAPTRPGPIGRWLLTLALAETIAMVLDLSIGLPVALHTYGPMYQGAYQPLRNWMVPNDPADAKPGLLLLVLGLVLVLSGAFDRWHGVSTSEE